MKQLLGLILMEWGAGCGLQWILNSVLRNCKTLAVIEGKHTAALSIPVCFGVIRGGRCMGEPVTVGRPNCKIHQLPQVWQWLPRSRSIREMVFGQNIINKEIRVVKAFMKERW